MRSILMNRINKRVTIWLVGIPNPSIGTVRYVGPSTVTLEDEGYQTHMAIKHIAALHHKDN